MVYESPSPGRDALFQRSGVNYALYEPGLLEPEGVSKVFSLAILMKNFCHWSKRLTLAGRSRQCQFLYLNLPGSHGWRLSKGHALEAVAKKLGYSLQDVLPLAME